MNVLFVNSDLVAIDLFSRKRGRFYLKSTNIGSGLEIIIQFLSDNLEKYRFGSKNQSERQEPMRFTDRQMIKLPTLINKKTR